MTTSSNAFPLELDHFFIQVHKDAPETQTLIALGFHHSGHFNRHIGLGTKGTYFNFENISIELLWIEDEAEFASASLMFGRPPFGFAFHHNKAGVSAPLPFETNAFHWDWMPPDSFLHFAKRDPASLEPLFFVVPDGIAFPEEDNDMPSELTAHPLGIKQLSTLRVIIPSQELSATAQLLSANTNVKIENGSESRLELTFDNEAQGKIVDVRPTLPLLIRY